MTKKRRSPQRRVMAVFEGAALSFDLPREATLSDLAEELDTLGERFGGAPLYVDVRIHP